MIQENQGESVTPEQGGGEGGEQTGGESITDELSKEYVGSLKRDYKKAQKEIDALKQELEEARQTPEKTESSSKETETKEDVLVDRIKRLELKSAGINHEREVELAENLQKETGLGWDKLLESKYFKTELESLRTEIQNEAATSNVKGESGASDAKNTTAYWQAKGEPPTPDQVPDRKVRAKIIREMAKSAGTSGKTYYND